MNGIYIFSAEERKGGNYVKNKIIFFEEEEKEKNISRRKLLFFRGEGKGEYLEKANILLAEEKKNEGEKGGKYFFAEEKEKGGKFLEMKNIFF